MFTQIHWAHVLRHPYQYSAQTQLVVIICVVIIIFCQAQQSSLKPQLKLRFSFIPSFFPSTHPPTTQPNHEMVKLSRIGNSAKP